VIVVGRIVVGGICVVETGDEPGYRAAHSVEERHELPAQADEKGKKNQSGGAVKAV
jgi:hypothetical protein